MKREERLDYYKTLDGLKWGMSLPNVINNIYDDFESRTCENCKYCVEYDTWEGEPRVHTGHHYMCKKMIPRNNTIKDFGCNEFERKDHD